MSMQSDVKATQPLAATGLFLTQSGANLTARTRIKSIYAVCGASAGAVVFRDGSGAGAILLTLNTPALADNGYVALDLPDQGIVAESGVHATITNTASVIVFFG